MAIDAHQEAREKIPNLITTRLYWGTDGELRILINLQDPIHPGVPTATVGSAKISETEKIKDMIRGLECGYVARLRQE